MICHGASSAKIWLTAHSWIWFLARGLSCRAFLGCVRFTAQIGRFLWLTHRFESWLHGCGYSCCQSQSAIQRYSRSEPSSSICCPPTLSSGTISGRPCVLFSPPNLWSKLRTQRLSRLLDLSAAGYRSSRPCSASLTLWSSLVRLQSCSFDFVESESHDHSQKDATLFTSTRKFFAR